MGVSCRGKGKMVSIKEKVGYKQTWKSKKITYARRHFKDLAYVGKTIVHYVVSIDSHLIHVASCLQVVCSMFHVTIPKSIQFNHTLRRHAYFSPSPLWRLFIPPQTNSHLATPPNPIPLLPFLSLYPCTPIPLTSPSPCTLLTTYNPTL